MANPFGRMVGPLPLGAWLAVVAGGMGLAFVVNRSLGGSAASDAPEGDVFPSGAIALPPAPGSVAPAAAGYESNTAWANDATRRLSTEGYGALTTQQATAAYLRGEPLSAGQSAIIEAALRALGPPPEPAPLQPAPLPDAGNFTPAQADSPASTTPSAPIVSAVVGLAQQVLDVYRRHGVDPARDTFSGQIYETAEERIERNVREVEGGARTLDDIEQAVRDIARKKATGGKVPTPHLPAVAPAPLPAPPPPPLAANQRAWLSEGNVWHTYDVDPRYQFDPS